MVDPFAQRLPSPLREPLPLGGKRLTVLEQELQAVRDQMAIAVGPPRPRPLGHSASVDGFARVVPPLQCCRTASPLRRVGGGNAAGVVMSAPVVTGLPDFRATPTSSPPCASPDQPLFAPQGSPLSSGRASYFGGPSAVLVADSLSLSAPRLIRPPSPLVDRRQPSQLRSTVPVVMPPLPLLPLLPQQQALSFEPPSVFQGRGATSSSGDKIAGQRWIAQEMAGLQAQAMACGGYRPVDWQRGMTTVTEPRRIVRPPNGDVGASTPAQSELVRPPSPLARMLERQGLAQIPMVALTPPRPTATATAGTTPVVTQISSEPLSPEDLRAAARVPEWMMLGEIALQKCAPNSVDEAVVLAALGNAYGRLGDPMSMRDLLERSLQIQETELGPGSPDVAATLTNLAHAYGRLGEAERKQVTLEKALAIKERFHINLLERAVDVQARTYGPEHPEVSATLMNLGIAFGRLGDIDRMRDLLERVLATDERIYGQDHIEVANTLMNLAIAYGCLGENEQKRKLLERALVIKESEQGPEHRDLAILRYNYAVVLKRLGDSEASLEQMSRAYDTFVNASGAGHPHAAMARARLSEWGFPLTSDGLPNAVAKAGADADPNDGR